ncbi:MAG TPA: hypothetical protein VGZ01_10055, partial [Trinickia sp.]|nr:hypothetical protein [Trinickia sp.]
LAGLGTEMAHLNAPQRERLIAAATGINDEKYRAVALAGLGAGMSHLSEPQRERLVAAITGIGDEEKAHALAALAAGLTARISV